MVREGFTIGGNKGVVVTAASGDKVLLGEDFVVSAGETPDGRTAFPDGSTLCPNTIKHLQDVENAYGDDGIKTIVKVYSLGLSSSSSGYKYMFLREEAGSIREAFREAGLNPPKIKPQSPLTHLLKVIHYPTPPM